MTNEHEDDGSDGGDMTFTIGILSTIFVPTTMLTNTLAIMLLRSPFRLLHSHCL